MTRSLSHVLPPAGWVILAMALTLTTVGLAAIYTGEADAATLPAKTLRQAGLMVAGLAGLVLVQIVGYQRMKQWAYPLYAIVLVLLALLIVARYLPLDPFIRARRHAYRWIILGPMSIQVSDPAKLAYILTLAAYLRFRTSYRRFLGLMTPFALTLIPVALILKEPDLGTSMLLPPTLLVMLFAAGAKMKHLLLVIALGVAAVPTFYFSPLMTPYQRERIQVVFRQNDTNRRWRMETGYQLNQSKIALGSGQVTGRGFREGAFFRYNLLPEEHNDLIFAVIGHQGGLVGCAAVLLCYFIMVAAGLHIALTITDPFGRLVAVGVCGMLFAQAAINVGMTIGLMPTTGMSLPFVSAGGSGLVTSYLAIGLLISVGRRRPLDVAPRPFEFDGDVDEA
ncbi:MAG: FtsW/RodA/SpoVE family cell cycle protein [Phycisphaerae bacterium]